MPPLQWRLRADELTPQALGGLSAGEAADRFRVFMEDIEHALGLGGADDGGGGATWTWESYSPLMGGGETDLTGDHDVTGRYRLWSNGEVDMVAIRAVLDPSGNLGDGSPWTFTMPPVPDSGFLWYAFAEEKSAWMPLDGWHGTCYAFDFADTEFSFDAPELPRYSGVAVPSWYLPSGSNLPALTPTSPGEGDPGDGLLVGPFAWGRDWPQWFGDTWAGRTEPVVHIAAYGRTVQLNID